MCLLWSPVWEESFLTQGSMELWYDSDFISLIQAVRCGNAIFRWSFKPWFVCCTKLTTLIQKKVHRLSIFMKKVDKRRKGEANPQNWSSPDRWPPLDGRNWKYKNQPVGIVYFKLRFETGPWNSIIIWPEIIWKEAKAMLLVKYIKRNMAKIVNPVITSFVWLKLR